MVQVENLNKLELIIMADTIGFEPITGISPRRINSAVPATIPAAYQ